MTSTKIPTDFANQRPRQMARKPKKKYPDQCPGCGCRYMTQSLGDVWRCQACDKPVEEMAAEESRDAPLKLIALGFLGALCGVLMLAALLGVLSRQTTEAPPISVNNEAAYLQITLQVSTNTPRPTATPEDTRTPYPSPTASVYVQKVHTSDNNLPQNEATATPYPTYTPYPTLTHYPTSTPVAYTPTSTPNATATQVAFDQKIANSKALRWEYLTWFGFGLLVLLSTTFIIILAVSAVRDTLRRKLDDASGEIYMEDLAAAPVFSQVEGVTVGELRDIRLMLAQGKSPREIEETVYGYAGGSGDNSAYKKVLRAIGYLAPHPPHRPTGRNDATQA